MEIMAQWPASLRDYLNQAFGASIRIQKLDGIKAAGGCYRLLFSNASIINASIIVKGMTSPREYLFYTRCRQSIAAAQNAVPRLYWASEAEGVCWIVIEDVAQGLPQARWQADKEVIKTLFQLHSATRGKALPLEAPYCPRWDSAMNDRVLDLYPVLVKQQLKPLLEELQKEAQRLFIPFCWIHGDTNPTNWGVREDEGLVLFDWERITCGSPAIDLAITLPGLGSEDRQLERQLAERYISLWHQESESLPFTEQELFRQILIAKLWSGVEFLAENRDQLKKETLDTILKLLKSRLYHFN